MGSFADYAELKVLDHVFGATTFTAPATMYIGFSTTTITDAGGNITEPSATGNYARIVVTNNTTNWANASAGSKSNAVALATLVSSAAWSTGATNLVDFFISDASSAGNIIIYGTLTTPQAVNAANVKLEFAISALVVTLA